MKKLLFLFVLSGIVLFTIGCSNQTATNDAKIKSDNFSNTASTSTQTPVGNKTNFADKKTIVAGIDEYKPFEFYNENNEVIGLSADIVKVAFKEMGYDLKIENRPFKRLMEELKSGIGVDCVFSSVKSSERETFALYPKTPIAMGYKSFYVLKDSIINFDGDFTKLKNYSIGIENAYSYGEQFDNYAKDNPSKIDSSTNLEQSINKLLGGRIQILTATDEQIASKAKEMGVSDKIKKLTPPVTKSEYYIIFSKAKNLNTVCDKLDETLIGLKNSGFYNEVALRYQSFINP